MQIFSISYLCTIATEAKRFVAYVIEWIVAVAFVVPSMLSLFAFEQMSSNANPTMIWLRSDRLPADCDVELTSRQQAAAATVTATATDAIILPLEMFGIAFCFHSHVDDSKQDASAHSHSYKHPLQHVVLSLPEDFQRFKRWKEAASNAATSGSASWSSKLESEA